MVSADALRGLATVEFDKALAAQRPVAINLVERLRRVHPDKTPGELIKYLNKVYLGTVTASGTGAGLSAVIPNGAVQIPVAIADIATFLESSVMYVLALAEIHGMNVEDYERRRFLVMTALLGNSGATTVTQTLGKRTVPHWSKTIINRIPMEAINRANRVLGPRFITKYGTRQGILVLGKQLPFAIGAAVGAGGGASFGYLVIRSTRKLLQDPPKDWAHFDARDEAQLADVIVDTETV